ncbi:MAG: ATPase, T2SS/T4P/T4SS family [Pseudomonadota bacterium]
MAFFSFHKRPTTAPGPWSASHSAAPRGPAAAVASRPTVGAAPRDSGGPTRHPGPAGAPPAGLGSSPLSVHAPAVNSMGAAVPDTCAAASVIERYADLPEYQSMLTHGPEAVYPLPPDLQRRLLAIDLGGRRALIVRVVMPAFEHALLQQHLQALRGTLRARGYKVADEVIAQAPVLADVIRNSSKAQRASSSKGEPLRLFERWIEIGVFSGATDVHIDVNGNLAQIRARVDGSLEPLDDGNGGRYPRKDALDAIAAGYNSTRKGNNNSQFDEDRFVDCMLDINVSGVSGQIRYQSQKGRLGPKVVLRILRCGEDNRITFERAGYAKSHLKLLREAARAGKGMVLIAGETGSGKSTSLKCFIETLPHLARKAIYTVEDPIEYEIRGAHQIEVKRVIDDDAETHRRYAEVMRSILRSDPDGVMMGEMRDKLTSMFCLQIAETGHLAMGTLHAHLISNIVPRLTNDQIGLSRQALTGPNILNLLVYQALVPMLCPACADATDVAVRRDTEVAEIEQLLRHKFKLPTQRLRWEHVGGCRACNGRGTSGKTVVAEMFQPDRRWLSAVRDNDDHGAVLHYRSFSDGDFASDDMTGKTVFEHAMWKALQGQIDVRRCEEFEAFRRYEVLQAPGHIRQVGAC